MTSHEPAGYDCPFCALQAGRYNERNRPDDVVAVTELAFARVSPRWWPANPGALLVVPRRHVENLYDLPEADGHAVWDLTKLVAGAVRAAYGCDGTSIRQHNEPAGGQDVWHLHVHVFPRYADDRLYERHRESVYAAPEERLPFAQLVSAELSLPTTF
ncbi:HIT family protein [Nocardioides bigeumensis]|uniref:HIT family protein n=1 Tax=Nocardioides bigeumensis TaxID=433657 RepID=UPI0031DFD161